MSLICTAGAMVVTPALARDSLAPVNAGDRWLPQDQWVTHHWLPYDERRLLGELRLSRDDLLKWTSRRHIWRQIAALGGVARRHDLHHAVSTRRSA
jgi:hypothetical protein